MPRAAGLPRVVLLAWWFLGASARNGVAAAARRNLLATAPDGTCHLAVETAPIQASETIVGAGILFALASDVADPVGPTVS